MATVQREIFEGIHFENPYLVVKITGLTMQAFENINLKSFYFRKFEPLKISCCMVVCTCVLI